MQIRQAQLEDISQLTGLFNLYRIFYRKESDPEAARKFLHERMLKKESVIFIAEENGNLLGFTQLYPQFSSTRLKKTWLLNDLYVESASRGRGISKMLLEAGKQLARETGAEVVLLETEKTNEIGNRLYPSAGFTLYDSTNFYRWINKEA